MEVISQRMGIRLYPWIAQTAPPSHVVSPIANKLPNWDGLYNRKKALLGMTDVWVYHLIRDYTSIKYRNWLGPGLFSIYTNKLVGGLQIHKAKHMWNSIIREPTMTGWNPPNIWQHLSGPGFGGPVASENPDPSQASKETGSGWWWE